MAVSIKLSPLLRKHVANSDPDKGLVLENGSGKKVGQIIEQLSIPLEKVASILVNHLPSKPGYVAKDGDFILLAFVLGGG